MKVLTRYLLRAHLGPFFFAFVALTGVILINTLAKELANLAGKGLPFSVVLEFFLLSLPANIALTLPMSVLVAVLYTFSTMASENEITALRASGVDLRRAALPLVIVAAMIAGGMVWFNDSILPAANYRWRVLITDVAQARPLLYLNPQTINPIRTADGLTPYYLEAGEIDSATGFLEDVAIYDVSDSRVTRTINADSGRMAFSRDQTDLLLTLYDGRVSEVDFAEPSAFQLVDFEQQVMRIQGVSDRLERTVGSDYRTDRDMTVAMMEARIDTLRAEAQGLLATLGQATPIEGVSGEPMSGGNAGDAGRLSEGIDAATRAAARSALGLGASDSAVATSDAVGTATPEVQPEPLDLENASYSRARIENLEYQIREFQVEIQKKFSIAGATLVFVLIGLPLALRFPSGGIGMVIAVSLGIFGIYYVGLIGGENLGNPGYVPPIIAMWVTNAVFGVLGVIGFLRLGREHGTGRGEGWGELPRWLRVWRLRRGGAE
jgi:lipopolysaccharide export system permease protein